MKATSLHWRPHVALRRDSRLKHSFISHFSDFHSLWKLSKKSHFSKIKKRNFHQFFKYLNFRAKNQKLQLLHFFRQFFKYLNFRAKSLKNTTTSIQGSKTSFLDLQKFFNRLILINETTHPILRERWLKPASNCLGHRSISRKISHWPHARLRSKTTNLSLVWNPSRIGCRCLICCCWIEHCLQCQCLG